MTNNPGLPRQLSTGTAGSVSSPHMAHQNVQQNQNLSGQQNQQLNAQHLSQNAINMLTPQQRTQLLQVQSQSQGQGQFPNQNQSLNQQFNQMQNMSSGDAAINAQSALMQNGQLPTLPNGLDGMGMYQAISNADLIATAKSMLPKLNSQLKATEAVSGVLGIPYDRRCQYSPLPPRRSKSHPVLLIRQVGHKPKGHWQRFMASEMGCSRKWLGVV